MRDETQPDFVRGADLLEASYRCARELHAGPDAPAEREFAHPVAVARMMSEAGFEEEVIAAALLHEVVEETDLEVTEIRRRFGSAVADLVAAMTEDQSISSYPARKAEHRDRAGRERRVAAIYVADKLATTRVLNAEGEEPRPERLDHFILTLNELGARHPDLPFLGELEGELVRLTEIEGGDGAALYPGWRVGGGRIRPQVVSVAILDNSGLRHQTPGPISRTRPGRSRASRWRTTETRRPTCWSSGRCSRSSGRWRERAVTRC